MTLEILGHPYAYEMECLARLFYPGERIEVIRQPGETGDGKLVTALNRDGDKISLSASVRMGGWEYDGTDSFAIEDEDCEWEAQRRLGALFFDLLCKSTNNRPPWGILTGVRPVNLCRKMMSRFGLTGEQLWEILVRDYRVAPQKAELALSIIGAQKEFLEKDTPDSYSLYVSIPFCPTRCLYCSFVSHAIGKAVKLMPDYLRLLEEELPVTGAIAGQLGLKLRSVYIGGGTPTTLSPEQLRALLAAIQRSFPVSGISEYTVEAGRPDSITKEKLDVLRSFGVSRISVNPQTMDDNILKAIGRGHSAEQTRAAMDVARKTGFESINMDVMAGLPGQTPESFLSTLEEVISMKP